MKEIPLTHGMVALIDDDDYDRIVRFKWMAIVDPSGDWRAVRSIRVGRGQNFRQRMHRLIMKVYDPEIFVDHINHNTLDNRKCNLRKCTRLQNMANQRIQKSITGFKGVSITTVGRFRAEIKPRGLRFHLGVFATPEEAAAAYDRAAIKYFGEFACINFPEENYTASNIGTQR